MRVIYYQAVFNGYDKPNAKAFERVKNYVIFTGLADDGRMANRAFKTSNPPAHADATIYLDGNIHPTKNYDPSWPALNLEGYDMAAPVHPHRKCAYVEIEACLGRKKITEDQAQQAHDILTREGLPKNFGLWECGILIRRNNETVRKLNSVWWEYTRQIPRDQIWLPLALFKLGKFAPRLNTMALDIRNNPHFKFNPR